MKNIQLEYLCAEVRKWEQIPGMTPPMVMRLLKMLLGIGMQQVMDYRGVYPCYYFNRMAVLLRSRHPRELVKVAADCGSFVVGRCAAESMNYYEVEWIASPLFLDEWALKQCIRDRVYEGTIDDDTTEEATQKLDSKMRAILSLVNNRRYKYIILSGGIQVKTWTDSLRAGMAAHGKDITPADISQRKDIQDFCSVILEENSTFRQEVAKTVGSCVDGFGNMDAGARTRIVNAVCVSTVYGKVVEYITNNYRRFRTTPTEGRKAWITNFIATQTGKRIVRNESMAYLRMNCGGRKTASVPDLSHPNGDYEYCYDGDSRRFYREGDVEQLIPDGAPARPSDTARWNNFKHSWTL